MNDERLKILEMFKEGKISMEEALELLDALESYGIDARNPEPELIDEEEAKKFDFQFKESAGEADSDPSDDEDDDKADESAGRDWPYFKFHMPEIRIPKIEIPPVRIPEIRIPPIDIPGESFFGGNGYHESRDGTAQYGTISIDSFGNYKGDIKAEKISISGMGRFLNNVETGKISISGVGNFHGNVLTEKIVVSGKVDIKGTAKASEKIVVSGLADFDSSVETDKFTVSGKVGIRGPLSCAELTDSGYTEINGTLHAKRLTLSGACRVRGKADIYDAEVSGLLAINGEAAIYKLECREGVFEIDGDLNSGSIYVELGRSNSRVGGDIRAESIVVKRVKSNRNGKLLANNIYAVRGELDNVKANLLAGQDFIIGPGCVIDRVEYTGTLNILDGAVVREQVRKEAVSDSNQSINDNDETTSGNTEA